MIPINQNDDFDHHKFQFKKAPSCTPDLTESPP